MNPFSKKKVFLCIVDRSDSLLASSSKRISVLDHEIRLILAFGTLFDRESISHGPTSLKILVQCLFKSFTFSTLIHLFDEVFITSKLDLDSKSPKKSQKVLKSPKMLQKFQKAEKHLKTS